MNDLSHLESDYSEFVEVDPTGRYGRYNEILGKGASKIVYRAFDEYEGIEVAWNQVKLYDFLQSPEDLERLYCEIHLLKTLKHKNIMKFYSSWVDTSNRNLNFVTEMFTSGTLRQYRLKHKRVNIRAVKHWCRQILKGLLFLHSRDPPVIHRDLKCDNIFVNGNQGEVKIGDLGLAAILRKSHAAHCVGTPEFMAPEVYEEAYNELVDIYSFGMCILEMVTFDYPYSECTHPAQIYKKVISGKKPDALYKVKDPEVREFVEKCLATVSLRLSARELLNDPFLQIDNSEYDFRAVEYGQELDELGPLLRQPYYDVRGSSSSFSNDYRNDHAYQENNEWGYHPNEIEASGIELFEHHEDEHTEDTGISIKGKRGEDGGIFLRLRISDKEGRIRNIYFPFDIETDTALSVATEMVAELDITDQDVIGIADMIDGEIASLVPEWQPGPGIEETPRFAYQNLCHNCASNHTSNGSFMDFLTNNPGNKNLQVLQCCRNGCASTHGRFEEITYQAEDSEHHVTEGASHYQEIWGQHESRELSSVGSGQSHSDEEDNKVEQPVIRAKDEKKNLDNNIASNARTSLRNLLSGSHSFSSNHSTNHELPDNHEKEILQELRWLKAKQQIQLRELKDQQLGIVGSNPSNHHGSLEKLENGFLSSLVLDQQEVDHKNGVLLQSSGYESQFSPKYGNHVNKSSPNSETQRARYCEAMESPCTEDLLTAKSFFHGSLLPHSLHRTVSLPVDAVNI